MTDERARNRERMPLVSAFVDQARKCFPNARVLYASENGHEVGNRDLHNEVAEELSHAKKGAV